MESFAHVLAIRLFHERPDVPAPAGKHHLAPEVAPLFQSRLMPQVIGECQIYPFGVELAADAERAEVVRHIGYAGIFPVDQAVMTFVVNQEMSEKKSLWFTHFG